MELVDHLEKLGATPGRDMRILDIGTRTGLLTRELARRWPEATIVAAEPARSMLEGCRNSVTFVGLDVAQPLISGRASVAPSGPFRPTPSSSAAGWCTRSAAGRADLDGRASARLS